MSLLRKLKQYIHNITKPPEKEILEAHACFLNSDVNGKCFICGFQREYKQ